MLCDNLEGWVMGGGFMREVTYVYLWLSHVDAWQKPARYCKAIILQLKQKRIAAVTNVFSLYITGYIVGVGLLDAKVCDV